MSKWTYSRRSEEGSSSCRRNRRSRRTTARRLQLAPPGRGGSSPVRLDPLQHGVGAVPKRPVARIVAANRIREFLLDLRERRCLLVFHLSASRWFSFSVPCKKESAMSAHLRIWRKWVIFLGRCYAGREV